MIKVIAYNSTHKSLWDQFAKKAKNTHFLFYRDYIEYHSDRFLDCSLLFVDEDTKQLLAMLPGSKHNDVFVSHGGLTFGGFILDKKIKLLQILSLFNALNTYLLRHHFKILRYKAIPHIYHAIPAEEDLYALFVNDAKLIKRDASSTIDLCNKLEFSGGKKNGVAKAKRFGIKICETANFKDFFLIMNQILSEKYATQATHTASEMELLAQRFPEHIKLYSAVFEDKMVAGVIMYLTHSVAHTQYMATTEAGREMGALDYLLFMLINTIYQNKKYFDFGISTDQHGKYLNQGLISQKEMLGARTITYDTYEMTLSPNRNGHGIC